MLAKAVTAAQMGAIAFVLAGQPACAALGVNVPEAFWAQLAEKRGVLLMGSWLAGNMLTSALTSTGAFEVLYGGELVFSKLREGRMPAMEELLQRLTAAMAAAE